ncbi:hypothetical protein SASPL_122487 [Salvia splendens]|uniref:Uncharacterized protein n=1 Tax=Salvia splendens TaxID=180675 RepID=A0A8X8XN30_SALSN|nr:hypothetical protein SASPL_122487 [Salvia splendens]
MTAAKSSALRHLSRPVPSPTNRCSSSSSTYRDPQPRRVLHQRQPVLASPPPRPAHGPRPIAGSTTDIPCELRRGDVVELSPPVGSDLHVALHITNLHPAKCWQIEKGTQREIGMDSISAPQMASNYDEIFMQCSLQKA